MTHALDSTAPKLARPVSAQARESHARQRALVVASLLLTKRPKSSHQRDSE
jgi:hypothetical protein